MKLSYFMGQTIGVFQGKQTDKKQLYKNDAKATLRLVNNNTNRDNTLVS